VEIIRKGNGEPRDGSLTTASMKTSRPKRKRRRRRKKPAQPDGGGNPAK
jgi:hypothetical protein